MLNPGQTYAEVYRDFRWKIPAVYNLGVDICDKWAGDAARTALIFEAADGQVTRYSFKDIRRLSNQFANALQAHGIERGDRCGILLPQSPETAIAHVAAYKLGAVAVPLFTLFGVDALAYRLANSEAKAIITDEANLHKIAAIRQQLPYLQVVIVTGSQSPAGVLAFESLLEKAAEQFTPVQTWADDPALIIYTSGTTGPPKGALHAHRTLLGHLPGVEFPHNFFPQAGDLFWTPADWAWIGGLIDVLFPSWHHGVPVLAHRFKKFDPELAFHLIAKHGVRNAFMPPTALKLMRQVEAPSSRHRFKMRSIGSGGETLGQELLQWGREVMGLTINEFYGQTECNLIVGCCAEVMAIRPGSMGLPIPGHTVEVVDPAGHPLPPGEIGEIAVKRPDPVMFLQYWRNPEATARKFIGDWLLTGDLARRDEQGYFWFNGRTDDVITSAGYRIGPAEIEECLMKHPAVAMVAVVGVPDKIRTEIVKAFIVVKPGVQAGPQLVTEIQRFVRNRLAAHEYPRQIEFIDELPMTATGKIVRRELKSRGNP
jgi:acetyl-CoA synthetase